VPTIECAEVVFEPKKRPYFQNTIESMDREMNLPNPRSPSLTTPSALTKIFAGLMSSIQQIVCMK
jgi:hypothetical protein